MNLEGLAFQALNGLASASGLFFVAAGLSLIFGVTRTINMAHGSLYMLGTYIAVSLTTAIGGATGFWGGIVAAAILVGGQRALYRIELTAHFSQSLQQLYLFAILIGHGAPPWLDYTHRGYSINPEGV